MAVIKKTVAISPKLDEYIRSMWAVLIEEGYDASYSTALNYMLLSDVLLVIEKGIPNKIRDELNSFLNDEELTIELEVEDFSNKLDGLVKKRAKQIRQKLVKGAVK